MIYFNQYKVSVLLWKLYFYCCIYMKIGIHGTELNEKRIDGTRIYLSELIKHFYKFSNHDFSIYHKGEINPVFKVPIEKYNIKKLSKLPLWTQTIFSTAISIDKQQLLWMPVQNLPRFRARNMKTVVTIHDLAFKIYPDMFPSKDLKKLNFHTDYAVKNANHLIAVSKATKDDLLKYYPRLRESNVTVVHHGLDADEWKIEKNPQKIREITNIYKISKIYIVYVGAVQPRKNLIVLIEAFEKLKNINVDIQLVCVGADAWMSEGTHKRVNMSKYKKDIIFTGGVPFYHLKTILTNAKVFVFPSVHEGFGIPILEAFISKVPVIASNSGSLAEVLGEAGELFNPKDSNELFIKLRKVLNSQKNRDKMIKKGLERLKKFSWDKTAKETIKVFNDLM